MATPKPTSNSSALLSFFWHPLRTILIVLISGICFLFALCLPLCCLLMIDRLYSDSCAKLIHQALRCRRGDGGDGDDNDDDMRRSDLRYGRFGDDNGSFSSGDSSIYSYTSTSQSINDSVV
ncbi:hypothetical protein TYRP_018104 [Tyrophagus putrescentiae]|nr:hypothetical protein TYRP_018104 [Tyrophagus putrescentiae]